MNIQFSVLSEKKTVLGFLRLLKNVLTSEEFDLDDDLIIIVSKKSGFEEYSTSYTLNDLSYDAADIVCKLNELELENYSETLIDKDNVDPPLLMVFGKEINDKLVYIKLKIRNEKKVICVSFHYAERDMDFPYRIK